MTNREWLFSLDNLQLAQFLCSQIFESIKMSNIMSVYGLQQWLNLSHDNDISNGFEVNCGI